MWGKLKWYAINYGVVKYLPVGVLAAMTALGTFMAAHAGMLEQWGVTYGMWPLQWTHRNIPSGPVILIELDTTSQMAIVFLTGLVATVIRAIQAHTVSKVAGPQPMSGGNRAGDPPATGEQK